MKNLALFLIFVLPFGLLAGLCLMSPTAEESQIIVMETHSSPSYVLGTDTRSQDTVAVLVEPEAGIEPGDTLYIYYVHAHSDRVQGAILSTRR